MTTTRARAAAALAVVLLALTGCGGTVGPSREIANEGPGGSMAATVVTLPDGGEVVCVAYQRGGYAGGIDCHWDGTR